MKVKINLYQSYLHSLHQQKPNLDLSNIVRQDPKLCLPSLLAPLLSQWFKLIKVQIDPAKKRGQTKPKHSIRESQS